MVHNLEPVLARHLGPVAAPDELWDRIQNPPVPRSRSSNSSLAWALVAALLVGAGMWGFRPRPNVEFRSDNGPKIRAWVKASTGLDIPLPAETAPSVRLSGASEAQGTAEVAFQIGGHDATLRVSKVSLAVPDGRHRFLSSESRNGVTISSWTMRGQLYTAMCTNPGGFRVACVLCHAGATPL
jgi:hypothetical protein